MFMICWNTLYQLYRSLPTASIVLGLCFTGIAQAQQTNSQFTRLSELPFPVGGYAVPRTPQTSPLPNGGLTFDRSPIHSRGTIAQRRPPSVGEVDAMINSIDGGDSRRREARQRYREQVRIQRRQHQEQMRIRQLQEYQRRQLMEEQLRELRQLNERR